MHPRVRRSETRRAAAPVAPPGQPDCLFLPASGANGAKSGQISDKVVVESAGYVGTGKTCQNGYAASRCRRCRVGRLSAQAPLPRSRHFHVDPELRHRGEAIALQTAAARGAEFRRAQSELDRRLGPQNEKRTARTRSAKSSADLRVGACRRRTRLGHRDLQSTAHFRSVWCAIDLLDHRQRRRQCRQNRSDGQLRRALRRDGELAGGESDRLCLQAANLLQAGSQGTSASSSRSPMRRDRRCKLPLRRSQLSPNLQQYNSR